MWYGIVAGVVTCAPLHAFEVYAPIVGRWDIEERESFFSPWRKSDMFSMCKRPGC